ncbi:MAG: hypothetical protein ACQEXJ_09310 [Myxococcota bacterium]
MYARRARVSSPRCALLALTGSLVLVLASAGCGDNSEACLGLYAFPRGVEPGGATTVAVETSSACGADESVVVCLELGPEGSGALWTVTSPDAARTLRLTMTPGDVAQTVYQAGEEEGRRVIAAAVHPSRTACPPEDGEATALGESTLAIEVRTPPEVPAGGDTGAAEVDDTAFPGVDEADALPDADAASPDEGGGLSDDTMPAEDAGGVGPDEGA